MEARQQFSLLRLFGFITAVCVIAATLKMLWSHSRLLSSILLLAAFLSSVSGLVFLAAGGVLVLGALVTREEEAQSERQQVGGRLVIVGLCGIGLPFLILVHAAWLLG